MISEYTPVGWSEGEDVSTDKLAQMAQNTQVLFEKSPRMLFNAYGITKDSGLRIFAGQTSIAPRLGTNASARLYFGSFFSPGCRPVINLTVNCATQRRYHVNYQGIGTLWPDHRGIDVYIQPDEINAANNKINYTVYINAIAIGW